PDLDEPHAAFDEPASDENLAGLRPFAVAFEDVLRLATDIERLGRLALHAISELKAVNAGVQRRVIAALVLVVLVEGRQRIELPPLYIRRQPLVADVLDQLVDLSVLRVDVSPLINARQKGRLP